MTTDLVLASASPRRRKLLATLGVPFTVAVPDVAEVLDPAAPEYSARESAARKLAWARARFPAATVIAADTLLDFAGRTLVKPADHADAAAMLRALSGRTHDVLTAVGFARPREAGHVFVERSTVQFKPLDDRAIAAYFAVVDPLDKAGAYDIDQHPDLIIASFAGSRTNIMGLPIERIRALLS